MKRVNNSRSTKGITLVALVITIIVLLILSGVTLNMVIGKNGIFSMAKKAKENYESAQNKELEDLENLMGNFDDKGNKLPENTPENPQEKGKQVALKEGWGTETVKYIKTSDGQEEKQLTKVATVYAVSVGNGETVPVPKGFFYVGGTIADGVIISDKEEDKYDGKTDKTTYEYTRNLKGNQFVWIPCSSSEYKKCDTWNGKTQTNEELGNNWWSTTTPKAELSQIEKYQGFYVGRYEAGLASTIGEFSETQTYTGSNQIYNKSGIPQSKAGVVPWNFIDWTHSKENAEKMYNNNYVSSGLITGTQWDVILNTMIRKNKITQAEVTNSTWGNYKNTKLAYKGRVAQLNYESGSWKMQKFGNEQTGTVTDNKDKEAGELLTTGASSQSEKYHIYDIAGNVWEWTEETSLYSTTTQYRVARGGSLYHLSSGNPACYRSYRGVSSTDPHLGFRVVLYVK